MAKKNDIFQVTSGPCEGLKCKLIRESSYSLTLELIEDKPGTCYKVGDKINLHKYEAEYLCPAGNFVPPQRKGT